MRGAICWKVGDEHLDVRDDIELLHGPAAGQVQVRIRATGLCHTDLSGMTGVLPAPLPTIIGHEAAGEVVAVGPGVGGVEPGNRVVVSWVPPCGRCRFCLGGQANLCDQVNNPFEIVPHHRIGDQMIFPFANVGTLVEEVILPAEGVVVVGDDVPFDVAAILGCAVMTGVGAVLNTAVVVPGSSVAVFGCGGVGMSVVQGARLAGAAEIVAVDLVEARLAEALAMGATHAVTPGGFTETADALHGGVGFDYAFEVVGRPETIRDAYDSVRRGGTSGLAGSTKSWSSRRSSSSTWRRSSWAASMARPMSAVTSTGSSGCGVPGGSTSRP